MNRRFNRFEQDRLPRTGNKSETAPKFHVAGKNPLLQPHLSQQESQKKSVKSREQKKKYILKFVSITFLLALIKNYFDVLTTMNSSGIQITKSMTKSAIIRRENEYDFHSSSKLFTHFFLHIPKTGGEYIMEAIKFLKNQINDTDGGGVVSNYTVCNAQRFKRFYLYSSHYNLQKCNMWMAEAPYTDRAKHVYSVVRSPQAHVLSQYFHCTESRTHKDRRHLMPSLNEWLDQFVQIVESDSAHREEELFDCFNPINLQSKLIGFNGEHDDDMLMKRYDIIGSMDYIDKTVCAITIRYTGFLPSRCVCDNQHKHHRLKAKRKVRKINHGVKHHGSTFQASPEQVSKIEKLTKLDKLLYERVNIVFSKQVQEIEAEFNVTLCDYPDFFS